jgi:hypothetical protein
MITLMRCGYKKTAKVIVKISFCERVSGSCEKNVMHVL